MDIIRIHDLLLRGIVGVNDWERKEAQDILINIALHTDLGRCGESDDLKDTVNYRTVTKNVIALVERAKRFTVEALAEDIARVCLGESGVRKVEVSVEKPGALRFARSVGVEIVREK